MTDKQLQNIDVFTDTQRFYQTDPILIKATDLSRKETVLYQENEYPELPGRKAAGSGNVANEVRMVNARTLEAAMNLRKEFPDKTIAVLNFASATRPGGGVKTGSSAQEEALCRCSTLFPTLDRRFLWQQYYDVNRAAKNPLYSDACIYSPGVIICKSDNSHPQRLQQDQFVTIDVISCAAPNLRNKPSNYHNPSPGKAAKISNQQLYEIQRSRARHILHIAAYNKVNILVLGAFGCGAFENDPDIVASAWRSAVIDYQERFDIVEFAIPKKPGDTKNFDAFHNAFEQHLHKEGEQ